MNKLLSGIRWFCTTFVTWYLCGYLLRRTEVGFPHISSPSPLLSSAFPWVRPGVSREHVPKRFLLPEPEKHTQEQLQLLPLSRGRGRHWPGNKPLWSCANSAPEMTPSASPCKQWLKVFSVNVTCFLCIRGIVSDRANGLRIQTSLFEWLKMAKPGLFIH